MESKIKERCIYCDGDVLYDGCEQLVKCQWCGKTFAVAKFENELAKMNAALEEGEAAKKALKNAELERDRAKEKLGKAIDALDGIQMSQRNADKALTRIAADFTQNKEEQREMKNLLTALRGQVNDEGNMLSQLLEMVSHGQLDGREKLDTLQLLSESVLNNQDNMLAAMAVLPTISEKLDMNMQQQNQLAGTFMTWFQNVHQADVKRLETISESSRALADRQKAFEDKIDFLQQSTLDIQLRVDSLHQEYNFDKLGKIRNLYHQAENEQKDREFDKAYETYKKVLAEGRETARDAEVYWRMLMCHYGLAYKKNAEGKMIPIILIPDLSDPGQMSLRKELRSCLKSRETEVKMHYEEQLSEIDEILESYRHVRLETKYDVFISVKQTDDFGRYTSDSDKASDLFDFLTIRGVNVFNSRRTLMAGELYEPRIIAALMSARVMIVVGSSAENMNSDWVRNEWSRYAWLQRREKDSKKTLLCYLTGDMDPYSIPKGLNPDRQAIREGINAQEDVLAALKDIIPSRKEIKNNTTTGKAGVSGNSASSVQKESLEDVLSQMTVWLMLSEYGKVLNKYELIKAAPPYLYEPRLHLYALCAEKKVDEIEELANLKTDLEKEKLFKLAMKLCKDTNMRGILQRIREENKIQIVGSKNKKNENTAEHKSVEDPNNIEKRSIVLSENKEKTKNSQELYDLGVSCFFGRGVPKDEIQAVRYFKEAAAVGHTGAANWLKAIQEKTDKKTIEDWYKQGKAEKARGNNTEALMWYRKAAEQGHAAAQFDLGQMMYESGSGIEKNLKQAVYWIQKAAEQGHADAVNRLKEIAEEWYQRGETAKEKQNYTEAAECYRNAARIGHANAQTMLGWTYETGTGVLADKAEAAKWYKASAEQENTYGQYNYARCMQYGIGVDKNEIGAAIWYKKAAYAGNAYAQCGLGECYYYGIGISKDTEEAKKWYCRAADQGNEIAKKALIERQWTVNSTSKVLSESAEELYNRAQKAKYEGKHKEAVDLYKKAAELGHTDAQFLYGYSLYTGKYIIKNDAEAVKWLRKAAEAGNVAAQEMYGAYLTKYGKPLECTVGVNWLLKAAESGNVSAQDRLGRCYEQGIGVPVNKEEAIRWYEKAAAQGGMIGKNAKRSLKKLTKKGLF